MLPRDIQSSFISRRVSKPSRSSHKSRLRSRQQKKLSKLAEFLAMFANLPPKIDLDVKVVTVRPILHLNTERNPSVMS